MRKKRFLAGSVAAVVAALIAGTTTSAAAAELAPPFFQGAANGGVTTAKSDPAKFKNCADPKKGEPFGTATPQEVGLDPAVLDQLATTHLLSLQRTLYVVRFGCLVKTGPLNALFENTPQHVWSMTKGFSTAVIGRAVTMGIFNVHDTFGKYFPDLGDAVHRSVTAQQLLQHTSGVKMNWANEIPGVEFDRLKAWGSAPMQHAPGTYFEYSQNGPATVNAMAEKAMQQHGYKDFQDFAQRELFDEIGIDRDNYFWMRDQAGHTEGYAGLHMRPIDIVRFSLLEQNGGVYGGRRLISPEFMREAGTGSEANPGFGYQTWVNSAPWYNTVGLNGLKEKIDQPLIASAPTDMTYGWGWRGRHFFTMPNLGLDIVTTSIEHDFEYDPATAGSEVAVQGEQLSGYHEFFRTAMHAVTDQKVPDPGPYTGRSASLTAFNPGNWVDPIYTVQGRLAAGMLDPNKPGIKQNVADLVRVMAHTGPFVLYN
ncbi:serine hydrolase [Amycolatopsis sp. NPDC047767]|uniref:serine hydrolase domain-containing protein n=1 Tax=Amycolatopsis sp. NPDC047767 TaxID=3156765 RepID=UPI003457373B